jgi:serine/threonine-protein kinase TTK/MPS1
MSIINIGLSFKSERTKRNGQGQGQGQSTMAERAPSKRSSLQFPIIPPLPSSKGLDKENASETSFRSKEIGSKRATPLSRRKPFQENGNDVFRSPSILAPQYNKGRVLRTAESMGSLFCLSARTSQEHSHLCQQIVDGPLSNDAAAWCRVVEVASAQVATSQDSDKPIAISDLMRLHRRAKARFSLLDRKSKSDEGLVLQIWLSYAEMQGKYSSPEEARATYRFIQNQGFGVKLATFYISLAKFESKFNQTRAIEIVTSGMEKGAEPIELLRTALSELNGCKERAVLTSSKRSSATKSPTRLTTAKSPIRSLVPPLPTATRKRTGLPDVTPKRQKVEEKTEEVHLKSILDDSNMSTGTVSLCLENISDEPEPSLNRESSGSTKEVKPNHIAQFDARKSASKSRATVSKSALVQVKAEAKWSVAVAKESSSVSKTRNRLSKPPRLKSVGLTGRAKRLTPEETNVLDDSDDDDTEPVLIQSNKKKTLRESGTKPAPKVAQIDLGYMMSWDPSRRGSLTSANATGDQSTTLNTAAVVTKSCGLKMGTVAETTESGTKSSVLTSSSHATSTASTHTGRSTLTNESCDSAAKSDLTGKQIHGNSKRLAESHSSLSPQTALMLSQCSTEFLPLVNENNVIRVNGVPYVKLGMIGKGGSSKVYRVLSKTCCVLAIKKVKLRDLDQKAIDGYANEIALLKKLQGNPAIIQMHDSEIDMNRKAIFVAMEVGEVDLSHVLQQQTLQSTKKVNGGQCSLNMNFIRLTWQQMLSAVHSIHEERIIHSDLKPANFLFVRGALKLIDFGIAKAIQTDDTNNIYRDSQIGTLNYMSPEAILDTGSGDGGARMRIGRASDIWSLGCILYQMVYGKTPFASLHMIQKLQAIVNPAHKIEYPGDVDAAAVDAIKRCLRRKADERPPIVGKGGLLSEHYFLNYHRTEKGS